MSETSSHSSEVVIIGAGIIGAALAYELAVLQRRRVTLIERGAPLSLTSDKSTECYRTWWPGPDDAMVRLISRSVDRLEQLDREFPGRLRLNRRGYFYAAADPVAAAALQQQAHQATSLGVGPLRTHHSTQDSYRPAGPDDDWCGAADGADLLIGSELIGRHFPAFSPATQTVLHARRAGWLSAQQLGSLLLEQARAAGAELLNGEVTAIRQHGGRVLGVTVDAAGRTLTIAADEVILAAGPLLPTLLAPLGLTLPLRNELHLKAAFADPLAAVPRDAGLLIWAQPIELNWDAEERAALADDPATAFLTQPLPGGVHCRPEGHGGSSQVLLLWDYHGNEHAGPAARWPLPIDPSFAETALRGMAAMLPGLQPYLQRLPRFAVDGGYYTATPENRPLIGRLPIAGLSVCGAFSGFGVMAALAAAELLAGELSGRQIDDYRAAFSPQRYRDAAYLARLADWGERAQL
jgi:glycine/D-amino acid oxidase-like deaminating enzyme